MPALNKSISVKATPGSTVTQTNLEELLKEDVKKEDNKEDPASSQIEEDGLKELLAKDQSEAEE